MANDIEVRHCRALIALDRASGVAAAARDLGVAQSTLSETLAAFERIVRTPLTVRRAGREALLTPAAKALLPFAHALVSASEAVAAAADQSVGLIRLGTLESISSFLLPGPLHEIRQRWPQVDVQVTLGLYESLRQRIERFELDAAIWLEPADAEQTPSGGFRNLLSPAQLALVVAPSHPLAHGVVSRDMLQSHAFLLGDSSGNFTALLRQWLGGAATTQSPEIHSAGSVEGLKRGVLAGDMIGVVVSYAVSDELKAKTLCRITLKDPLPEIALFSRTSQPPPWGLPLQNLFAAIAAKAGDAGSDKGVEGVAN